MGTQLLTLLTLLVAVISCGKAVDESKPMSVIPEADYASHLTAMMEEFRNHHGRMTGRDYGNGLFTGMMKFYYNRVVRARRSVCVEDVSHIFGVLGDAFSDFDRSGKPNWISPRTIYPRSIPDGGSTLRHFFAAAKWEAKAGLGKFAQQAYETYRARGHFSLDNYRDDAYGFIGAYFARSFLNLGNDRCSCLAVRLAYPSDQSKRISHIFGLEVPLVELGVHATEVAMKEARDRWLRSARRRVDSMGQGCAQ